MDYIFGPSGVDVVKGRKLQVRIGSSIETLSVAKVNDDSDPHFIDSPYFTGFLVVRVKNFEGVIPSNSAEGPFAVAPPTGYGTTHDSTTTSSSTNKTDADPSENNNEHHTQGPSEAYFQGKKRLFALQLSGRFKHNYTADDIVFGSQFEKKCTPPYGSSIAMKFATLIDPALQTDIFCDSPWIFSPLLCSMNVVNVQKALRPIVKAAPSIKKPLDIKNNEMESGKTENVSKKGNHGRVESGKTENVSKKGNHGRVKSDVSSSSMVTLPKLDEKSKKGQMPLPSLISNTSRSGTYPNIASSTDDSSTVFINCPDPNYKDDSSSTISAPLSQVPQSAQESVNILDKWKWAGGKFELEEDTKLLQENGKKCEFTHDSSSERRKYFQKSKARQETVFSPDDIYNFEIYAPFINLSTFDLSLGININVLQYLNNQPLRMMAKSLSLDKYIFIIEFDLVSQ